MTLIVGAWGTDGIVLAADSRGTYGDPRGLTAQNDSMVKVHPLSKHTGVAFAGDTGMCNQILDSWQSDREAALSVTETAEAFRQHARTSYAQWFPTFVIQQMPGVQSPQRPVVTFLIAGYDSHQNQRPVIYSLNSVFDFAPSRLDHGFHLDGVPQYAQYLFNRLYRLDITKDRLKSLAAYAITETASQDGKVGGPVRMASITADHGYQQVPDIEIAEIVKQNEARSESLRRSFFEESTAS